MKNFNLTLGIVEPLKIEPFEIVSQDINGNKLNINLVIDGSLIPYNLTGTTVILYFKRDDGVRLQQYATITNAIQGQIEIVLDTDIIATRGKVFAEVAVYAGEEMKCTSQLFGFQVRKNINDSETVVSGNDLPNYRQEMQRLETILDNLILSAGDSNPEIVAARYSMLENKTFTTLGDRLDFIEEKARQNVTDLETSITAVADDLVAHKEDMESFAKFGMSAVQSIANITATQVLFDQTNLAKDYCELQADGTVKILKKGTYEVILQLVYASNASGYRDVRVDGLINRSSAVNGSSAFVQGVNIVSKTTDQIITSQAYQTSGGALDLATTSFLIVKKVG